MATAKMFETGCMWRTMRALFLPFSIGVRLGERYNVGARSERSNLAVVTAICDYLDHRLPRKGASHHEAICFVADRPGHDFRYAINPDKIEREIGWRPEQSFDVGLQSTIEWYIANEPWWREIRSKRYDGERLGLNQRRSRPALDSSHLATDCAAKDEQFYR